MLAREGGLGDDLDVGLVRNQSGSVVAIDEAETEAVTVVLDDGDDDDDEVQVTSPRSVAKAMLSASTRRNRAFYIPVLDDEDLELRLGLTGTMLPHGRNTEVRLQEVNPGLSLTPTIDLTSSANVCEAYSKVTGKRKQLQEENAILAKEVGLICAICMDTMKEEMSTTCGHIFCKCCISEALNVQKRCPTCRRKLTHNQIHRIFISGSSS